MTRQHGKPLGKLPEYQEPDLWVRAWKKTALNGSILRWSAIMALTNQDSELACRERLESFFGAHPDAAMQKRALKALRFLAGGEEPLAGKPEGWAAGIIYALANRDRQACGVPGLLNSEFEALFGVSMGTIRRRAAQIEGMLAL